MALDSPSESAHRKASLQASTFSSESSGIASPALIPAAYTQVSRTHFMIDLCYAPPIIDMDAYDGGSLGPEIGAQYFWADNWAAGARLRFQHLFIETETSLDIHFIELQALLAWRVASFFEPYVALGPNLVGVAFSDDLVYEAHLVFSLAALFTIWLENTPGNAAGIDLALELNILTGSYEDTETVSGTTMDDLFCYLMFKIGFRYSVEKMFRE